MIWDDENRVLWHRARQGRSYARLKKVVPWHASTTKTNNSRERLFYYVQTAIPGFWAFLFIGDGICDIGL